VALGDATGVIVAFIGVGVASTLTVGETVADWLATEVGEGPSTTICSVLCLNCWIVAFAFFSSFCFCTMRNHISTPSNNVIPNAISTRKTLRSSPDFGRTIDVGSGV